MYIERRTWTKVGSNVRNQLVDRNLKQKWEEHLNEKLAALESISESKSGGTLIIRTILGTSQHLEVYLKKRRLEELFVNQYSASELLS